MSKQDRNDGLTQLELPGMEQAEPEVQAMANLFLFDDPDPTPVTPYTLTWAPSKGPALPDVQGVGTVYSIFGHWWYSIELKAVGYGYWSHIYELPEASDSASWHFVTKVHGDTPHQAFQKAKATARRILVEGQRPKTTALSPELQALVRYFTEHGEHLLARDCE